MEFAPPYSNGEGTRTPPCGPFGLLTQGDMPYLSTLMSIGSRFRSWRSPVTRTCLNCLSALMLISTRPSRRHRTLLSRVSIAFRPRDQFVRNYDWKFDDAAELSQLPFGGEVDWYRISSLLFVRLQRGLNCLSAVRSIGSGRTTLILTLTVLRLNCLSALL